MRHKLHVQYDATGNERAMVGVFALPIRLDTVRRLYIHQGTARHQGNSRTVSMEGARRGGAREGGMDWAGH